ncbi:MAG: Iron-sulfur cluster carrier protein [Sodalis sp.]|nr:MAG: Iron-sulfur cluster carrier protein [Sodalis sp.]
MASKPFYNCSPRYTVVGLDYLILDMPLGTGDIQLTLVKNIPVISALVVTTPQNISLAPTACKGIAKFAKVSAPVLALSWKT